MDEAPELTRKQKQLAAARAKGNARRQRRARIREEARTGQIDAIALIAGYNEYEQDEILLWRVEQLVKIVPGIGSVTAHEIYEVGQFSPTQLVSSLNPKRREQLAELCSQGQKGWRHRA